MEAIEFSICGELFFFENNLSTSQTTCIKHYATQYFHANQKQHISMESFVAFIENQLQITLKPIKIVKVIAI